MKRSKIVATVGPATEKADMIEQLIRGGANVFRFNLKYNTAEWHNERIKIIRELSKKLKVVTGVMIDLPRGDFKIEIDDFDYVALSYLKTANEVTELKKRLLSQGKKASIIAKIENRRAIENLEEIVKASFGVMVARGDLGKETPLKALGYFQKKIIDICRQNNKPVIVATQMLLSMTDSPKPTRAEATDVANAVFDGTDALMLSEETALGKYPAEAVLMMAEIAEFCENTNELRKVEMRSDSLTEKLISATAQIVDLSAEVKAVIVFTKSGESGRLISKYRLGVPIIAVSDDKLSLQTLGLSFGIVPYYKNFEDKVYSRDSKVFKEILKDGLVKEGEIVMVVHGKDWFESGSTNHLSFEKM